MVAVDEDDNRRKWLPELIRIQGMYEIRPEDGVDEYARLVMGIKLPAEYRVFKQEGNQKVMAKRAAWLDEHHPLLGNK